MPLIDLAAWFLILNFDHSVPNSKTVWGNSRIIPRNRAARMSPLIATWRVHCLLQAVTSRFAAKNIQLPVRKILLLSHQDFKTLLTNGLERNSQQWKGPPDKQKAPMGWTKELKRTFIEKSISKDLKGPKWEPCYSYIVCPWVGLGGGGRTDCGRRTDGQTHESTEGRIYQRVCFMLNRCTHGWLKA